MMITYETLEREYKRCIQLSNEPNLIQVRRIKSTPAVRRKVGRWLRQGITQRGNVVWVFMKNKSGALIV